MSFTISKIPYTSIQLAKRDLAFIQQENQLMEFIPFRDTLAGLREKITNRHLFPFFRKELVLDLHRQYATLLDTNLSLEKIESPKQDNTFTITTAHQPSLFTGPLYVIYKAASCIHLANQLQQEFPSFNFVPIFVLGAEDHDFEEINHLHLYNKVIEWEQDAGGPTGQMSTDGIDSLIQQVTQILPDTEHRTKIVNDLFASFSHKNNFAEATQEFIHRIFGKYGLVVLQMNSPQLKRLAIPIFRKEILEQPSYDLINQSIAELKSIGFKPQAKPRELNLFYMTKDLRKRIVFEDNLYRVLDTDITWSPAEIMQKLEQSPELFSPNVITRPLYQELILPNIAYVGGGGELAYWQERHTQFQAFELSYPVLIRRNSAVFVSQYIQKQLDKIKLPVIDLFKPPKQLLLQLDSDTIDLSVKKEMDQLTLLYDSLAQKADLIDTSLRASILSEKSKQEKSIKKIESKINKAYKQKNQSILLKIEKLQGKLMPNGGLQERHDNFLPIFADYGQEFIDFLVQHLDPLDKQFLIIKG